MKKKQEKAEISTSKHVSHKISIVLTFTAFTRKAHFDRVIFENIRGNVPYNCEIFGNVGITNPPIVFVKNNIKTPVQTVFYAPVRTNRFGK